MLAFPIFSEILDNIRCDVSFLGSHGNHSNDKFRKIKDEYETKISSLNKELKNLQSAKREHARLLKSQSQYESQIKALKADVSEMKRTKVRTSLFQYLSNVRLDFFSSIKIRKN